MKAKTVKLSICACGFPALAADMGFICGGCLKEQSIRWVWVEAKGTAGAGYLPEEIFERVKP